MKIIVTDSYEEMSAIGAEVILQTVREKPNCTLGLATGTTPLGMYRILIQAFQSGRISFRRVKTVNLDEYVGLRADNENSYAYFMCNRLFQNIDIDLQNTHIPDGSVSDLSAECERYTKLLQSMPRDVQVLGLGSDGHIGFNEPGAPFDGHTHITALDQRTVQDNARLFRDISEVPSCAVTMGIADIMQAKRILMLANGKNKAEAVWGMVRGEVTEAVPASVLQRHPDVIAVFDRESAAMLSE